MRSSGRKVLTAVAVIALVSTCLIFIPSSSATDYTNGMYGAADGLTYSEIDTKIKDITGEDISYWINKLSDDMENYDITKFEPDLHTEISIRRDTSVSGHEYTITDHVSAYIEAKADISVKGNFPNSGKYDAQDGESEFQLLLRIFNDHGAKAETEHGISIDIKLYVDVDIRSTVDIDTGEITDSYVDIRFLMYDKEDRDFDVSIEEDKGGDPEFLSVSYDRMQTDSTFFTDLEVGLTIEGLKAYSGTEEKWTVRPVVKEHVYKSAVSSDLAGSLWIKAIDALDGEIGEVQLPKLILKLLGSGGRMMDVFKTINSLTSSDIPDMSFTATLEASNDTDAHGNQYCKLKSLKDGGPTFMISAGAYTLNLNMLVSDLPSYIISDKVKIAVQLIFTAMGWDDIQVNDISGDEETQAKCNGVVSYVNDKIGVAEEGRYSTPTGYIAVAGVGIGISILVGILIWRRVL